MTKKQGEDRVELEETSGEVVIPAESRPLPTLDNLYDFDYQVGTWSGLPNYGCPVEGCLYASLDAVKAAEHYFDIHLSKEA